MESFFLPAGINIFSSTIMKTCMKNRGKGTWDNVVERNELHKVAFVENSRQTPVKRENHRNNNNLANVKKTENKISKKQVFKQNWGRMKK